MFNKQYEVPKIGWGIKSRKKNLKYRDKSLDFSFVCAFDFKCFFNYFLSVYQNFFVLISISEAVV
tara:strand:+ start:2777 stop:2971 length:195 start_codon:yes stop_codon:yes gene_type:complete